MSSSAPILPVNFREGPSGSRGEPVPWIPTTGHSVFGLYRYPARFIPQAVAYLLAEYGDGAKRILDPFAGLGTTGLVARLYGIDYELWDLNPLLEVVHGAATLTPPALNPAQIVREMRESPHRWLPSWKGLGYWFPEKALEVLERAWGYYHHLEDPSLRLLLAIPLLKATRVLSYNDPQRQKLSRSPRSIERVHHLMEGDYRGSFYHALQKGLEDLLKRLGEYLSPLFTPTSEAKVLGGVDSLERVRLLSKEEAWDLLITSPPYLQAQEYLRYAKLDLLWLGYPEERIRELKRRELPYRKVEPVPVLSKTYETVRSWIGEPRFVRVYERYFHGLLGTLTPLSTHIRQRIFLFVGRAGLRGEPIPIDYILAEHFQSLGWKHEITLVDTIRSRALFHYGTNPATGLPDPRMRKEYMVILSRP